MKQIAVPHEPLAVYRNIMYQDRNEPETAMPVTANKPAPYAPGGTILEVIDRRRNRGLPTPITAEVLGRAGIAPTLIPRVMQSLQGLDLIDADGQPTIALENIRLAPEADYKKVMGEWIKG